MIRDDENARIGREQVAVPTLRVIARTLRVKPLPMPRGREIEYAVLGCVHGDPPTLIEIALPVDNLESVAKVLPSLVARYRSECKSGKPTLVIPRSKPSIP